MKLIGKFAQPITRKKEESLDRRKAGRHQGERERRRRLRQIEKFQLNRENGAVQ